MNENLVLCKHFNRELPGLNEPPLKGPLGKVIFEHVSADAFNEWLELQIKIINEERLDLSEEAAQERLYRQMINFLNLSDIVE